MTTSASSVLERAERGLLSAPEIDALAKHLATKPEDDELYTRLHALGHAGDARYAGVVEPYLETPEDPMLARLALQILCDYWGLASRYRDHILRFIAGVPWDVESDGDVRLMAISCAGDLMAFSRDGLVAEALLGAFADFEGSARDAAYAALVVGTGGTWADVPSPVTRPYEVDREVIRRARELTSA